MNLFEQFLFEDSNNDEKVPDADMGNDSNSPPDIPDDMGEMSDDPPDISENDNMGMDDDLPPDMDMGDEDLFGDNEEDSMDDDDQSGGSNNVNLGLDEKISAIMNKSLYQRFLSLLSKINNQLSSIEKNGDVLYALSKDSLDIIGSLNRLDENIRLYLENKFMNENFSVNQFFFNECLNLFKLLNDKFDKQIHKGIKSIK